MEKEWHKIIAFNGSQEKAFEEMVCQVAQAETYEHFSNFERIGTPDGGIECYWKLKDGSEWGWQAKFFQNLRHSEYNAVKRSLFEAAETHPELRRYFVCLPHNLSDGRRGKNTQKNLWDKYKSEWEKKLKQDGHNIELIFWGSTQLFSKLAEKKHEGTRGLFFNKIEINESHLNTMLEASIRILGPKYSSSLNLKLEQIVHPFHALARSKDFKKRFEKNISKAIIKIRELEGSYLRIEETKKNGQAISAIVTALLNTYGRIDFAPSAKLPVLEILRELDKVPAIVSEARATLDQKDELIKKVGSEKPAGEAEKKEQEYIKNRIESGKKYSREMRRTLEAFQDYLMSEEVRCANEGVLILRGNWGSGKSHLLADIALERKLKDIPSIFLLGMNFPEAAPRNFIQQSICPKNNLEEYLEVLNSFAKTKNERIFLIIDAINEGRGKSAWKENIEALIHECQQYPFIGLIISYRTTYEKFLLPDNFNYPQVTHHGFEGIEDFAVYEFFQYYNIQQTVPLLNPEFKTPLFLKLFCETLQNLGLHKMEEGFDGISTILQNFLYSINDKIGKKLEYLPDRFNLVQDAVFKLVQYQLGNNLYVIPYQTAHDLIEPLLSKYSNHRNFLEELIKENLLVEDYFFMKAGTQSNSGVSFSYERIYDHYRALLLLKDLSPAEVKKAFKKNGKLYNLFGDNRGLYGVNAGLLSTIAVILPEKTGQELYTMFDFRNLAKHSQESVFRAVLESILWRRSDTTNEKLWDWLRSQIKGKSQDDIIEFYNTILHVCVAKSNYFNANFLHNFLIKKSMTDRDYLWTIPVERLYKWYDSNAVKRIIEWCWSNNVNTHTIDNDTAILLGKTLCWFFTSSNRYVRDKATKAFVSLFSDRAHLLKGLLKEFIDVNDPYVLERCLAGVYGAVSRSKDNASIKDLSQFIYSTYFSKRKPPLNILSRDYCKGIVETAVRKNMPPTYFKREYLYPPFQYSFPKDIPDESWVKSIEPQRPDTEQRYSEQDLGVRRIISSVNGFGDFSRYIIGTNHNNSVFTTYKTVSRIAYENLSKTLKGQRRQFLTMYAQCVEMNHTKTDIGKKIRAYYKEEELESKLRFSDEMKKTAEAFLKSKLTPEQFRDFTLSKEYIQDGLPFKKNYEKPKFNLKLVERYILKRVFELGYKKEYFGAYDSNVDELSRSATKAERIGKKYQWIAYYEIMALLTDNYDFLGRHSSTNDPKTYKGGWEVGIRNIDPTILLKPKVSEDFYGETEKAWWFTLEYTNWKQDRKKWLSRIDDIPDLGKLLQVKDPAGKEWYMLHGYYTWKQHDEPGTEYAESNRRDLWIGVYGLLVSTNDKKILLESGSKKLHWLRDHIPNNTSYYDVFIRELYDTDAYAENVKLEWVDYPNSMLDLGNKQLKGIKTVEDYSGGDEYDCSWEKYRISLPSESLFNLLDGNFGDNDACIYNKEGAVIACDTSKVYDHPHGCFTVDKQTMDRKLKENGIELVWYFFGEKEDIGANTSYIYRMLISGFAGIVNNQIQIASYFQQEK